VANSNHRHRGGLIVAAIVVIGVMAVRRRSRLRQRFGPEYDVLAEECDSKLKAESELAGRAKRVHGYNALVARHRSLGPHLIAIGHGRQERSRFATADPDLSDGMSAALMTRSQRPPAS
jgi:hypothetical protein